jgi:hypothetical protein
MAKKAFGHEPTPTSLNAQNANKELVGPCVAVVLLSALDDDYGWPHHRFDYSPPAPPAVTCRIGICTCGTWAESSSGRLIIVCGALCGVFVRRSGEGYRYIRMVIRCRWIAEA